MCGVRLANSPGLNSVATGRVSGNRYTTGRVRAITGTNVCS